MIQLTDKYGRKVGDVGYGSDAPYSPQAEADKPLTNQPSQDDYMHPRKWGLKKNKPSEFEEYRKQRAKEGRERKKKEKESGTLS